MPMADVILSGDGVIDSNDIWNIPSLIHYMAERPRMIAITLPF